MYLLALFVCLLVGLVFLVGQLCYFWADLGLLWDSSVSLDLLGLFGSVGLGFLIGLVLDCLGCLRLLKLLLFVWIVWACWACSSFALVWTLASASIHVSPLA